jgi:hypothetical protein
MLAGRHGSLIKKNVMHYDDGDDLQLREHHQQEIH